ncbi:Na+-transporting NADH:ubiquinone oxidoreductase subunit NqrC [Oikeobacillus pervagus]|uniref:Na+-transporting NADH:ubiquinone oxidoreductase subunit NqrC n=1 Tax=Oikeobacillus pervagus TaxID=1325931 RepID=A0AAJ1WFD1_9BACI|nr:stressosome-associated protein Prli42 [Oikeobacillus pervagus]MDQ0213797.1 Na+-transporting NADH:ubiquinone oxidoreductase subunit NqrC [Oikeobacillus pervagus]
MRNKRIQKTVVYLMILAMVASTVMAGLAMFF